jgi:cell division protein FtsB
MLVIGLLLVLIACALIVGAVYDGAEPVNMEAFGQHQSTTVAGVFFIGVGTTLLFFLGMWLLKSATARSRKQRADRKAQRVRHRESVAKLEQERNELRAENERLAKAAGRPPATATAPRAADAQRTDTRQAPADTRPPPGGPPPVAPPRDSVDLTPSGRHADAARSQAPARSASGDQVSRDHQHRA